MRVSWYQEKKIVTVFQMDEYINIWIFKEDINNQTNYYEVYSCLKNVVYYGIVKHLNIYQDDFKVG